MAPVSRDRRSRMPASMRKSRGLADHARRLSYPEVGARRTSQSSWRTTPVSFLLYVDGRRPVCSRARSHAGSAADAGAGSQPDSVLRRPHGPLSIPSASDRSVRSTTAQGRPDRRSELGRRRGECAMSRQPESSRCGPRTDPDVPARASSSCSSSRARCSSSRRSSRGRCPRSAASTPPLDQTGPLERRWRVPSRRSAGRGSTPSRRMDAEYYLTIAAFGYAAEPGRPRFRSTPGFFPGYPVARARRRPRDQRRARAAGRSAPRGARRRRSSPPSSSATSRSSWRRSRSSGSRASSSTSASPSRAAIWLLVCPVAFFGSAYLAESLFLWLSIASLLSAFRRRMGWAALFGAAAAFTRPVGVLLVVPLLLISLARARRGPPRPARTASCCSPLPAGVAGGPRLARAGARRSLGLPRDPARYGHGGFPDFAGVADLFRIGGKDALCARPATASRLPALAVAAACAGRSCRRRGPAASRRPRGLGRSSRSRSCSCRVT